MDIYIYTSPAFILSGTWKHIFSVPYLWSPISTAKDYSPDNNLSAEVLSDSVPKYLLRFPPSINGVPHVKRNRFLLVSMIPTSNSDWLSFRFHYPFTLISTDFIVLPRCIWRAEYTDFHMLLVCSLFIRSRSSFSTFKFLPCSYSWNHW